jgi:hypothetical protein
MQSPPADFTESETSTFASPTSMTASGFDESAVDVTANPPVRVHVPVRTDQETPPTSIVPRLDPFAPLNVS